MRIGGPNTPYHLVPSGKTGVEAFAVIREAMEKKGMVALGRLVMSTRERICAIEIEESGMLMTTLRTAEEVRDVAQMPDVPLPKPDAQMLAIAEKIVDQQAGEFDPAEFVDRYEDALRELVEQKKKGHVPRLGPPPTMTPTSSIWWLPCAPRRLARNATWPDAQDLLRQLEKDKLDAKHEIRQVLDRYREKYRISARQTNEAMWGYVNDLLDDFFSEKEEALKAEIEEDIERENQRPSSGAP
jgi:hypothetical protein